MKDKLISNLNKNARIAERREVMVERRTGISNKIKIPKMKLKFGRGLD